mmetsp:Transcript_7483/g.11668  ORF Transcript_7483/g.11668 Transcript_7483/m.11668 type:complete len:342 (-) Transcript_7483:985-2010(-)
MPKKKGVDKKTLVEDNELFLFDDEVEPILSVLCGKTLEVSRMEVLEEEELKEMREQQDHFKRIHAAELGDIERMESNEHKRLADFAKLKNNMREKKKNKQLAHRKIVTRVIAKSYLGNLRENTYRYLADVGFFHNQFKTNVLDNDLVPWLHQKAFEFVQDLEVQDRLKSELAADHLTSEQNEYLSTVEAEAKRKQEVKEEKERQLAQKLEEKRQRRAAKEAKRKAEERAALGAEIEAQFIKKGVSVADIAIQDLVEIDGNGEPKPVVGAIGGALGQIIMVLSILESKFNRTETSKSNKSKASGKSKSSTKKAKEKSKEEEEKQEQPKEGEPLATAKSEVVS